MIYLKYFYPPVEVGECYVMAPLLKSLYVCEGVAIPNLKLWSAL